MSKKDITKQISQAIYSRMTGKSDWFDSIRKKLNEKNRKNYVDACEKLNAKTTLNKIDEHFNE